MNFKDVEILKKFSLFANLDNNQIKNIAHKLNYKEFTDGELLIDQTKQDQTVYFILKGTVKVYIISEEGKEINLAVVGPYNTLGEIRPLINTQRNAYCEAVGNVETLRISGEEFRDIIKSSTDLAFKIIEYFAGRIIELNKKIEENNTYKLKERTLILLKKLVKNEDCNCLKITHDELASILSATRPRVTEAIKELEKDNKIKNTRESIEILGK